MGAAARADTPFGAYSRPRAWGWGGRALEADELEDAARPPRPRRPDPVSELAGDSTFVEGKSWAWLALPGEAPMRVSRFYPALGLAVDMFEDAGYDRARAEWKRVLLAAKGVRYALLDPGVTQEEAAALLAP